MNKPKIILIISHGHSGSTLMDKVLGNHPNAMSLGELFFFSRLSNSKDVHCGCSQLYANCSFWQEITEKIAVEKGIEKEEIKEKYETVFSAIRKASLIKDLFLFLINLVFKSRFISTKDKEILENTVKLFRTVHGKTNSLFLVDSSKRLDRAIYLKNLYGNEFDFKFIHLVRDGRSVLGSFHRKNITFELKDKDSGETTTYTKKKNKKRPETVVWSWLLQNLYTSIFIKFIKRKNRAFVNYESFTYNPGKVSNDIMTQFGIDYDSSMIDISNNENHMMGGHAARVNAKEIRHAQATWKEKVPKKTLQKFYRISGMLNRLYGYKN